ncbi:phosphate ABC transporter substrate-binding protein PstS [Paraoerskovia marina]|uniref:phosphate ABC transporter substrate-binding protein PstS n=1 Tax=Paraoerskovia marina TaxID=545619 RepID=UPI0009DD41C0|nr:phosphate ABC transporter substrate-binding protein PstS [Paraoerskovia marina]
MKLSRFSRAGAATLAAGALAVTLTACGSDDPVGEAQAADGDSATTEMSDLSGQLNGAGASSQEAAMNAWRAGFQGENPDVTVNYDPIGSGGGRTNFIEGGTAFAGSDAALDDEELVDAQARCLDGEVIELPMYISPIAVIFNVEGVDQLKLDPATIAGIFNDEITSWDDPAIVDQNPDVELPSEAITPVHRSDESGTTENFTEYLEAAGGDAWPHEASGDWPTEGGQSAQGTSGVVQTVQGGSGTIGYADASQAGSLGTAEVKVGEEYVPYSPEAAAKIVDASEQIEGRGPYDHALELARDTTESGAYPIVLVSYHLACATYEDQETADLVKAFLGYVASEEGQEISSSAAGSAPISDSLRADATEAIDAISAQG